MHSLLHANHPGDPFHEYVPNIVEPCCTLTDGLVTEAGRFHLLSCGHLIAIDEIDRRCGRNCQHATEWASSNANNIMNPVAHEIPNLADNLLPPVSATQAHDSLYCEVCTGIPYDRYIIMHPPKDFFDLDPSFYPRIPDPYDTTPKYSRRCIALTRPLLNSEFSLDNEQTESLLSRPFFHLSREALDWMNVHYLMCGHQVWCAPTRPCASNCNNHPQCKVMICLGDQRQSDAIFCQECVGRAELVYARYARIEKSREEMGDPGIGCA
ncbi:uncharacterized protein K460DRAFT_159380 [Cucurbitaria berberidis CBS 394.84]|uniref:Uncharacterized protein n=1 Tax=Cucurbitaria berberidis CBS 394.84 TaxID=1168544 RepID=A0A9P4L7J2_9PLEO|nr:uncharacterized protein K460DRAFT_159380 [Cucurbitaria berberidis CBS 394.84]KAF1844163.1 hypothetical protein K460DRAFT_159380 [Cucurbitaria berberidis CBS 394.84]